MWTKAKRRTPGRRTLLRTQCHAHLASTQRYPKNTTRRWRRLSPPRRQAPTYLHSLPQLSASTLARHGCGHRRPWSKSLRRRGAAYRHCLRRRAHRSRPDPRRATPRARRSISLPRPTAVCRRPRRRVAHRTAARRRRRVAHQDTHAAARRARYSRRSSSSRTRPGSLVERRRRAHCFSSCVVCLANSRGKVPTTSTSL